MPPTLPTSLPNPLLPFAMWSAFPTSDYYGSSAPYRANSRRRTCPLGPPAAIRVGRRGMVPTFTTNHSTGEVPNFAPATSPRLRRTLSPWPPYRPWHTNRE